MKKQFFFHGDPEQMFGDTTRRACAYLYRHTYIAQCAHFNFIISLNSIYNITFRPVSNLQRIAIGINLEKNPPASKEVQGFSLLNKSY